MKSGISFRTVLLGLFGAALLAAGPRAGGAPDPTKADEQALKKAQAGGKYRMLLRQIKAPGDREKYGAFQDYGFRTLGSYAGHDDLPRGWWVYSYPYWYIWRDLASAPRPKRPWGPEQATGEPDTEGFGDIQTAWASQSPDGQDEWLLLEYAEPVVPTAVLVYETYNPGALCRVTVFKLDGTEVEVWKGKDPTEPGTDRGISEIPIRVNFKVCRVKLYLDSPNVAGWNEVDAVGLRDKAKKVHWAVAADASSTYAQPYPQADMTPQIQEERIRRLEEEVRELKKVVAELQRAQKRSK